MAGLAAPLQAPSGDPFSGLRRRLGALFCREARLRVPASYSLGGSIRPITPMRLFPSLALLALFVAVWTSYSVISAAPAAIHHDMAEAYVWGREFRMGYFQHPPFWAWIAGLWFKVFPRADWAFSLLAMLNAGLGLYGSWMLIGDFATGDRRLAATALLLLTPFYTFLALKYNANSIFLSIWPWTIHFFVRSIDNRRLSDAILFGLLMGLAMLSKYFALILAVTCLVGALVHPARRVYFTSASPYVSFLVAALLFAPHAWWLVRSDAPPIQFFVHHSTGHDMTTTLLRAVELLVGVILFHALAIALVALTKASPPKDWTVELRSRWRDPRFRVLATLALLPLVLTLIAGVVFRLKLSTNMTIGIFSLLPLLLIELAGSEGDERLYRLARGLVAGTTLAILVLSPAIAFTELWLANDPKYIQPRKELAQEVTRIWHEATNSPLQYVAGSQPYENAVAFYSADQPHAFIHFDFHRAPWVTPEDLSRAGFLGVCAENDARCLASNAAVSSPQASQIKLTLAHSFWGYTVRPFSFIVTLVPPHR
jgi:4-amino-4-deoxy-L-arabinose transferase-like glycosyltransferase